MIPLKMIRSLTGLALVALMSAAGNTYAQTPNSFAEQMIGVNAEWQQQPDVAHYSEQQPVTGSHRDLIRYHLESVVATLEKRATDQLDSDQAFQRETLLKALSLYAESMAFPVNTTHDYQTPIFIDPFNNFCAVGHLLKVSGHEAVAREISAEMNFNYLVDIDHPALPGWASSHGFTLNELAWIQPSYGPYFPVTTMKGGLDEQVLVMKSDETGQGLYAGGDFTEADYQAGFNGIAFWNGTDWMTLGDGLSGSVSAIAFHNGELYAGGLFNYSGTMPVMNVARFDGTDWHAVGSLNERVEVLYEYNGELYAGGHFNHSATGGFAHLAKWDGTNWVTPGEWVAGPVSDMTEHNGDLIIAGEFSPVGLTTSQNLVAFDGTDFQSVGSGLPVPVSAVASYDGELVAGCDLVTGTDTVGLVSFDGQQWSSMVDPMEQFDLSLADASIEALSTDGNRLLVGGSFFIGPFFSLTYGNNIMAIAPDGQGNQQIMPLGNIGQKVHTTVGYNGIVAVGGEFNFIGGTEANKIGMIDPSPVSVEEISAAANVKIYPNPANQNQVQVSWEDVTQVDRLVVTDPSGRNVMEIATAVQSPMVLPTAELATGYYLIELYANEKLIENTKLIVN